MKAMASSNEANSNARLSSVRVRGSAPGSSDVATVQCGRACKAAASSVSVSSFSCTFGRGYRMGSADARWNPRSATRVSTSGKIGFPSVVPQLEPLDAGQIGDALRQGVPGGIDVAEQQQRVDEAPRPRAASRMSSRTQSSVLVHAAAAEVARRCATSRARSRDQERRPRPAHRDPVGPGVGHTDRSVSIEDAVRPEGSTMVRASQRDAAELSARAIADAMRVARDCPCSTIVLRLVRGCLARHGTTADPPASMLLVSGPAAHDGFAVPSKWARTRAAVALPTTVGQLAPRSRRAPRARSRRRESSWRRLVGPDARDVVQLGAQRPARCGPGGGSRSRSGAPRRARAARAAAPARSAAGRSARRRPRTKISSSRLARLATRLVAEAQLLERLERRAELALAAVDQHEVGQVLALLEQSLVAPAHDLAHRGEVVGRPRARPSIAELAVVRLLRQPVLEARPSRPRCPSPGCSRCRSTRCGAARPRGRAGRAARAGSPATAGAGASTPARRPAGVADHQLEQAHLLAALRDADASRASPAAALSHASSSSRSGHRPPATRTSRGT